MRPVVGLGSDVAEASTNASESLLEGVAGVCLAGESEEVLFEGPRERPVRGVLGGALDEEHPHLGALVRAQPLQEIPRSLDMLPVVVVQLHGLVDERVDALRAPAQLLAVCLGGLDFRVRVGRHGWLP